MDLLTQLEGLLIVVAVSAVAPVLAALIPGRPIPQVVLLILGGVLVGPEVLAGAEPSEVELLSNVGLAFVFLLAGFEIEPRLLAAHPGRLAIMSWIASLVLATIAVGVLAYTGYVKAFVPVALALTTAALGTVLPILREHGLLERPFARYFLAGGAVAELLPILAIAIFLGANSEFAALISIVAIAVVAVLLSLLPKVVHGRRLANVIAEGADTTGQTTLRWAILLLLALVVMAGHFGLDVVLGAFLAGAVLRHWAPGDMHEFEAKLDAIGYGFFIPVFFVAAGMGIDLDSIRDDPARVLVFLVLLIACRAVPVFAIYRKALAGAELVPLALCLATSLPLIVALTQIGLENGTMRAENAAALVGAGVLSVLVLPAGAVIAARRQPAARADDHVTQD